MPKSPLYQAITCRGQAYRFGHPEKHGGSK